MLDNFEPEGLKATAATLKAQFPHLLIEASGGITPETLGSYVSPHVDIVSQGKLTQGTSWDSLQTSLGIAGADQLSSSLLAGLLWLLLASGYGFVDFSLKIQKADGVLTQ